MRINDHMKAELLNVRAQPQERERIFKDLEKLHDHSEQNPGALPQAVMQRLLVPRNPILRLFRRRLARTGQIPEGWPARSREVRSRLYSHQCSRLRRCRWMVRLALESKVQRPGLRLPFVLGIPVSQLIAPALRKQKASFPKLGPR